MRVLRTAVIGGLVAWVKMAYLGRTWGSTRGERRAPLPGDEIVPAPHLGGDHAITVARPPREVWPWLQQVGWHRGGWYTYRWVDALLFPANRPSADVLLPGYPELKVGDVVPDGPPQSGCFFRVVHVESERCLVLHSTTHLPASLLKRESVHLSWTWTFVLTPLSEHGTRFHFRWRAEVRPLWLRLLAVAFVMPADALMGRSMCRGLRRRVERAT